MSDWRAERDTALLRLEREAAHSLRAEAAQTLCDLAFEAPVETRAEFAPAVVRLLADKQPDVRCAGIALAAEVLPGPEAQTIFTQHLADPAARVRVEAAGRLADLSLPELRGTLAGALTDEAFEVRFEAARGMAALRHRSGLEVLCDALDNADLRFRAAAALAVLGEKDAVPKLQRVFRSWFLPAFERTQVAGALAMLGEAEGASHLFKRAGKTWSMDRAMAIELLGEVKASGARERLIEILRDQTDSCRGAAARGLGRLGDTAAELALLAVLDDTATPDDVRLDLAEGLLRLRSARGRLKLVTLQLRDKEAQAELAAMLEEP